MYRKSMYIVQLISTLKKNKFLLFHNFENEKSDWYSTDRFFRRMYAYINKLILSPLLLVIPDNTAFYNTGYYVRYENCRSVGNEIQDTENTMS